MVSPTLLLDAALRQRIRGHQNMNTEVDQKMRANKYLLARYLKALNALDAHVMREASLVCDAMRDDLRINMRHAILDAAEEVLKLKELFWAAENLEYLADQGSHPLERKVQS
jgi:hypothetical protein